MNADLTIRQNRRGLTALIVLLAAAYLPTLYELVVNWYRDGNYSHGFLVPLVSLYLIWRKRKELLAIEIIPNPAGLAVLIAGILLFILGNAGSEYFTARISLIVALFGLVLYLFGTRVVKKTWFEIAFLVFMIPIPYVLYFSITFPMQLLASKITVFILDGIGMTVVRQGNIIHLAGQSLEVAEACSGLRSLISLLALGAIYAYISQKKFVAKIILFASTVPIAIAGNIFRVFLTTVIVYLFGIGVTDEPFHSIMGASVFVVAFQLLFLLGIILKKIFR
jgi:exosortase